MAVPPQRPDRPSSDSVAPSEASYRSLVQNAPLAILRTSPEGRVLAANAACVHMLGYDSEADLLRLDLSRDVSWEPGATARLVVENAARSFEPVETTWRRRDGRPITVQIAGQAVRDAAGKVLFHEAIVQDVTDVRFTARLQAAILQIVDAANTAPTQHALLRAVHGIVSELMPANNFYIALYDPQADLISFPYYVDERDAPPTTRRPRYGLTEFVLRSGKPLLAKPELYPEMEKRGDVRGVIGTPSVDWLGVPLRLGDQTIGVVVAQTYTEGVRYTERERLILEFVSTQIASAIARKRNEEALRESEERYRRLVESMPDAIWVHADGNTLYVNPACVRLLGLGDEHQILGRPIDQFLPPESRAAMREAMARVVQDPGQASVVDLRIARPDGQQVDVDIVGIPVTYQGHPAVQTVLRDVTARKQAEAERRATEAKYRAVVENAPVGIYQTSQDGHFLTANPTLARMLGFESVDELLQRNIRDVYLNPAERDALVMEWVTRGRAEELQLMWQRRDGTPIRIELDAHPVRDAAGAVEYFEGFVRDITDQSRLEEQLRQSQKMEAVGRLAGGIAHDFNNLLTAIVGFSSLLLKGRPAEDPDRGDIEEIRDAANRAAALTQQLLAFSRKQVLQPTELDLNRVVTDIGTMLRRLIGEHIALDTMLAEEPLWVKADRSQLEQVIINLAVNARDAMPAGGTLSITTEKDGGAAVLEVRDTGVGMDAATRDRIFEPFFTTKGSASGTGLGLATVYGIVQQSGGQIIVASAPGRGTVFRITLPRIDQAGDTGTAARGSGAMAAGGTETILVVEDERAVRALARQALEGYGYHVVEAASGPDALRLLEGLAEPLELLVTDVVMPGMSGRELAERLTAEREGLRVLYVSGYSDAAVLRLGDLPPRAGYLPKPYTPDTLAQKVREVLDAP